MDKHGMGKLKIGLKRSEGFFLLFCSLILMVLNYCAGRQLCFITACKLLVLIATDVGSF